VPSTEMSYFSRQVIRAERSNGATMEHRLSRRLWEPNSQRVSHAVDEYAGVDALCRITLQSSTRSTQSRSENIVIQTLCSLGRLSTSCSTFQSANTSTDTSSGSSHCETIEHEWRFGHLQCNQLSSP